MEPLMLVPITIKDPQTGGMYEEWVPQEVANTVSPPTMTHNPQAYLQNAPFAQQHRSQADINRDKYVLSTQLGIARYEDPI